MATEPAHPTAPAAGTTPTTTAPAAGTTPTTGTALARRLVDSQFPQWAGLPLRPVEQAGSDHEIHRLGEELSVRVPRHDGAAGQARKEFAWLPRLAPHLPLALPVTVAVGEPDHGRPWPWAVSRWLEGTTATVEGLGDSYEAAETLAAFLTALQGCLPGGTPTPAAHPELHAARPLADRDEATRGNIAELGGVFGAAAMTALWDEALAAPEWDRPPVWFHGDFHTGNLLTVDGRLSAVIDFGELGLGDPARDLTIAYTLLSPGPRAAFRTALGVDDATWARGRGWALTTGLNAHAHHAAHNPRVAAQTTRQITQALAG